MGYMVKRGSWIREFRRASTLSCLAKRCERGTARAPSISGRTEKNPAGASLPGPTSNHYPNQPKPKDV